MPMQKLDTVSLKKNQAKTKRQFKYMGKYSANDLKSNNYLRNEKNVLAVVNAANNINMANDQRYIFLLYAKLVLL